MAVMHFLAGKEKIQWARKKTKKSGLKRKQKRLSLKDITKARRKNKMATLKQKTAFKKMLANVSNGNPETMGQVLVSAGYKKIAKQPCRIIDSKGFQELLGQINDQDILNKFYEILRSEDKRSSLAAGIELLKLKDRYPQTTTKVQGLFAGINIKETEKGKDT